ncbi:HIRAN domain-containing protein [Caldifermentibacillus hisashii]|uniref:HIRAN domain-containing protein n=1 Tax=Caldifermentibacillus hisashii TaxID=996558 RepID=UPI001C0FC344|nr:HIRAN domain-containing protein [Caldifermentibacillus hisashii]MBU5342294.1 HIRAN domain-containing protein [Caldifermentibacillus hisashii]
MGYRVAGVTKENDKGINIQDLLKRLANGYKKNDYIESWEGLTKREMIECYMEQSEFEGQTISNVIRFEPEPDNPYDPNAIKVFMKDVNGIEHHVGYIRREDTQEIKEQMQREDFKYIAVSFTGGKYRSVDYDVDTDKEVINEEELTRGLELTLVFDKKEPVVKTEVTTEKRELTKEEKLEKTKQLGENLQKSGNAIAGCGCLLTLLITIPIIIFLLL